MTELAPPAISTITATSGTVSGTTTLNVRPTGFVTTGSMSLAREDFTATVLNNGSVLVVDGDGSLAGYFTSTSIRIHG